MVFVFDENYSHWLAEALHLLELGNGGRGNIVAEVHHVVKLGHELNIPKENQKGSYSDEEVIKIAGVKQAIIFTQDDDFKRIKHLYSLYKEHKVGVVYFATVLDSRGYWNMITYMIERWNDLKSKIEKDTPPFCYHVKKLGVLKCPF